jgi:hypothetical protein
VSSFPYSGVLIHEWIVAPKSVVEPKLDFRSRGEHAARSRVTLQLRAGGAPAFLEWTLNAGRVDQPESYASAFLVDRVKVRGVDFHELPRSRFYREISPAGWHQDIIGPVENDQRREPVAIHPVTDLQDFATKVARLWHIELPEAPSLL